MGAHQWSSHLHRRGRGGGEVQQPGGGGGGGSNQEGGGVQQSGGLGVHQSLGPGFSGTHL